MPPSASAYVSMSPVAERSVCGCTGRCGKENSVALSSLEVEVEVDDDRLREI